MTDANIARGLAFDLIAEMGLTCIRIVARDDHVVLTIGDMSTRTKAGSRLWFRNAKEAAKVFEAVLSRCFEFSGKGNRLLVRLPVDQVIEKIRTVAFTLGITPIQDCDFATTFDSVHHRVEAAIAKMKRDGHWRHLRREYANARDSGAVPPYGNWLAERMRTEFARVELAGIL